MTTSSRAPLAAALVLALALGSGTALAQAPQPSAADLESARELYKDAKALRESGDLRGALQKFKQAHAYGQTPVTALELGRTHMQLGELVEAREVLLSIARMKVQPDETEKSAAARQEGADLAEEIRPKIPTLDITITGVPESAPVELVIDGANVPVVSLSAMRKTNPGTHSIVVRSGSREAKSEVAVAAGETKPVTIALDGAGSTATTGTIAGPATAETPAGGRSISPIVWAGLGVGVAGLAVGGVTGILAMGKASKVDDACNGTVCPRSAEKDVSNGRTMATISTIGFAAGAAGLAAAAVGWFVLSPPKQPTASAGVRVKPIASPWFAGVDGTF